jgi:hypothetical protein
VEPPGKPGRFTPDVNVEPVEARVVTVTSELDLELLLVLGDRQVADGTGRTDTVASPRTVRSAARELAIADSAPCFLAQE